MKDWMKKLADIALTVAGSIGGLLGSVVAEFVRGKLGRTVFVCVLSGCAVNSGVVPMGNDTYMVSRQAPTGFHGMGKLKADAMREAYAQCQKTGKSVEVIEAVDAKPPYIFGNFPKTEIRFKCVSE